MQIGLVPITAFRHPPGVSEHTPHREGGIPYRNENILNSTQQHEIPKTKNQNRIWREQGKQRKKEKVTHNQRRINFLVSNNKCEKMNSGEICIPPPEFYKLSLKAKGRINPSSQVRKDPGLHSHPAFLKHDSQIRYKNRKKSTQKKELGSGKQKSRKGKSKEGSCAAAEPT